MRAISKAAVGELTVPRLVVWAAFSALVGFVTPLVFAGANFPVQCVAMAVICVLL